jgi:hypothetical protein
MALAFLFLLVLTALSVIAAVALTLRLHVSGRAERLVAATVLWNFLILLPIYGLGWIHRLDATNLALASILVSAAALALSARGRPSRDHVSETGRALFGLVRLPLDAVLLMSRPVTFTLVVFLGTMGLIAWSVVSAYYGHLWRMWDCLWYHEPIIAFTIQNRGFQLMDLPDTLQRINSLPRAGEMTSLWFVIFTDRRLIDITNSLIAPALVATEYLLAARYAKSRVVALGWACAFFLTPSIIYELGTSLVDVHVAFLCLAALWFASRPKVDLGHSALAAVALTLAVGMKYQAVVPVGAISLIVLARTWLVRSARVLHRVAVTVAGGAAIAGFAATTYLRNYLAFKNPVWPFVIPSHPAWPGYAERGQDLAKGGVAIGVPRDVALKNLFSASEAAPHYGLAFPWVVLPLFAFATILLAVHVLGCASRRGRPLAGASGTDWRSLLLLCVSCLPAVAVVWTSPALDQARYHYFVIGSMVALVAWATGASRLGGIAGEGAIGAACVIALMGYFDANPIFIVSWRELRAMTRVPYPEREVTRELGTAVNTEAGIARERELKAGDLVVFGDDYGSFPAEFFNNRFSNRAVYVPDTPDFVQKARDLGATWIYCTPFSRCGRELSSSGWVSHGALHLIASGELYHRVTE